MIASVQRVLGKYTLQPFNLARPSSSASDITKLSNIIDGARHNLFVARTIFPYKIIADTIKIDRQKLTIVHNELFRSTQIASTQVKDIMNIQSEAGLLYGSITITSKHFLNNTQTIKFLKRRDVFKIQKLIQGFMIAHRAKIDTDNIDEKQLLPMLLELGEADL